MRNRSPLDGSGEWFGRLGWHEQNALKNSVSHIQHIRRQKGIPKINSHPKSQGFFPYRPETLQKRILQMHNYRRIIINLQKNHGRLPTPDINLVSDSDSADSCPLQTMKDWYKIKPEMFKKRPYHLTGCDS
jgi:hypothetical protein